MFLGRLACSHVFHPPSPRRMKVEKERKQGKATEIKYSDEDSRWDGKASMVEVGQCCFVVVLSSGVNTYEYVFGHEVLASSVPAVIPNPTNENQCNINQSS